MKCIQTWKKKLFDDICPWKSLLFQLPKEYLTDVVSGGDFS